MKSAIDEFIQEARSVSVTEAAERLGFKLTRANYAGPCPSTGGTDRFSISPGKQAWNCRYCGVGGRDGIGLAAHVLDFDLHQRSGFIGACEAATAKDAPDASERESDEERDARLARIEQRRLDNEKASATKKGENDGFRDREVAKARGLYLKAPEWPEDGRLARYLKARTSFDMAPEVFANLRLHTKCTYWHGHDARGFDIAHYTGPAMIAPFVDLSGRITGCHQTWIDLDAGPKFRPDLGRDDKGMALPTKKMRGTKKGSFIPVFGLLASTRWVGGEGIENVLTIAGAEGFRTDTFYFAAGDLGNLAGPADPKSAFPHPTLKRTDKRGRVTAVRVQGPVPKPDQDPGDTVQVADHVTELIFIADGDSERFFTAAAMARAEARLSREGRHIETWWPPEGLDFANLMTGADA